MTSMKIEKSDQKLHFVLLQIHFAKERFFSHSLGRFPLDERIQQLIQSKIMRARYAANHCISPQSDFNVKQIHKPQFSDLM